MFLDAGVEEDVARLKAEIAIDDAMEIQVPDVYSPQVYDDDWTYLNLMLNVSRLIQQKALAHMRSSRRRSFKPKTVLVAIKRKYPNLFEHIHEAWAINAVTYAKCNHELRLRGEITTEEANRRTNSCIWYVDCAGLSIDFEKSVITVARIDGKGTFDIPVNNLKRRDSLRNIKLEKEGTSTHGLQLTYHHHDDVKHESPFMKSLMKEALSETKQLGMTVSENRPLLDIFVTLENNILTA
jgi:hypothetical protein